MDSKAKARKVKRKSRGAVPRQGRILLPLLSVLKSVKPEQRQILMAHLDDKTRDRLYETIAQVLKSEQVPLAKRVFLKSKLSDYKTELRYLTTPGKSGREKKRKLAQVGGSPMNYVLQTAIPLLLNLFPK